MLQRSLIRSPALSRPGNVWVRNVATTSKDQPQAIEGSVPYYNRHIAIVDETGDPARWPKKLEQSDHILATYAQVLESVEKERGGSLRTSHVRITAMQSYPPSSSAMSKTAHDVLVFPDLLRIHDIRPDQITSIVHTVANESKSMEQTLQDENLAYSNLDTSTHLLICAHANRDFRCACQGPKLLSWLQETIDQGHRDIQLWASSHYGGHRHAGNVVAYPSGDWFGLINSKEEADALIEAVEDQAPLRLASHWRGRMGLDKREQVDALKTTVEEAL